MSIAYTVTCTDSYIRLAGAIIIGLIAVVTGTYKTPPLFVNSHAPNEKHSVTMSDMVSAESIKAQMPHVTLTRIFGKPSHCQLKQLKRKLTDNLMAVPCPWGHNKGHLGLVQDPVYVHNTTVQPSQFQQLHRRPTLSSWPSQLQANARNIMPATSLLARLGLPT